MIPEGRQQLGLVEVQRGQSFMLMKGSVATNLEARLLRRFPI